MGEPTQRHGHRARRLAAISTVIVLSITACGDGDSAPSGASPADAASDVVEDVRDDVVAVLEREGLSSLATALADTDLPELQQPFTLLAPNDEAFTRVTGADLADLVADPDRLVELLRHHLLPETVRAVDLGRRASVTAVGGSEVDVDVSGSELAVGGARVVRPDLEVAGGVVHVVDHFIDHEPVGDELSTDGS